MYRSDHVALAKAVRDAGASTGMSEDDIQIVAGKIADVCAKRTPEKAVFDRELFMAYALSPVLTTE